MAKKQNTPHPVAAAEKPVKGRPESNRQSKEERKGKIVSDFALHLNSLRSSFKDILEKYTLNLESQFIALNQAVASTAQVAEGNGKPAIKKLKVLTKKIAKLKLKPAKGRIKDILAIHKMLKSLQDHLLVSHED